jgi:hypothetical protein
MTNRLLLALACVLLAVRLPSLVQPMGADQGLYAYVGERIRAGEMPYLDAWDQKPPAIHLTYAVMRTLLPRDASVPAADLLMAAMIAAGLAMVGARLASPAVGAWAAIVFLALSNPAFARLGGVSVRAQCETFIAASVTGAFVCLTRAREGKRITPVWMAGALFGVAFTYKYNAAAYALAGVFALSIWKTLTPRTLVALAGGFAIPIAAFTLWFAVRHGLPALYDATILYNLHYSGETYQGPLHAVSYLLTFPIRHARVDGLWLVGGAGCAILLALSWRSREPLVVVAWVAAACLTIAINGSRELPQYFVQAGPALALAAAWGGSLVRRRSGLANAALIAAVLFAIWRVDDFTKLADNTRHDARYVAGRVSRTEHLARYGDRATRKYSALAMDELGTFMRAHSRPEESVYVFGFSSAAYVTAERRSASRFFWSRPVIVGFNDGKPGYGVSGLLADLQAENPAIVALQKRDWYPDVDDSADFFMATPTLAGWLLASYDRVPAVEGFDVWIRRSGR